MNLMIFHETVKNWTVRNCYMIQLNKYSQYSLPVTVFYFQFTKRTTAPNSYVELSVANDIQKSKVPPENR